MKCLGIDVGGTFTDLILVDSDNLSVEINKVPSTPVNQSIAVKNGINKFISSLEDLTVLVHGSTVATNAIIERKGAKTGLITTKGFKDILEIGRQNRINLYSLFPQRNEPLVPRNLRFEIDERLDSIGKVLSPLKDHDLKNIIKLIKENNIESVAISLLFSFFNPLHETLIEERIRKELPELNISRSSIIFPVFREYERTSVTVLNSYVAPLMTRYFEDFCQNIQSQGIKIPPLVLLSTGGVTQMKGAAKKSVETVYSGLAGGVLGGLYSCNMFNISDALTLDIGGTSTDVASIVKGRIVISNENEISGFPIPIPSIAVKTIGAGGGSIAKVRHEILTVGPESAGAHPGPSCYNLGGTLPTVTDANLVLGFLNPDYFCGGSVKIFPELANETISKFAEKLKFDSVELCASGIIKIFENNISLALRKVSTERGYDTRKFTLIAFGGAGPLHCCSLAENLSMEKIIIPPYPGVWSAYGLLTADIRHDLTKSILKPLNELNEDELNEYFSDLVQEGIRLCEEDGFSKIDVLLSRNLDIRLVGQSYELTVQYYDTLQAISNAFDKVHEAAYGYCSPKEPREIVNIKVTAVVSLPDFELEMLEKENDNSIEAIAKPKKRKVFLHDEWQLANVYERSLLRTGNRIKGPSIIEQADSTTLIDSQWIGSVKADGHLILERFEG